MLSLIPNDKSTTKFQNLGLGEHWKRGQADGKSQHQGVCAEIVSYVRHDSVNTVVDELNKDKRHASVDGRDHADSPYRKVRR